MLKGYVFIYRNAEGVHGKRKVGNPWSKGILPENTSFPQSTKYAFYAALLSHVYVFGININKFQTGIRNQSLHGRGGVRTLRGHWPSSEEICNVEYAALTIVFQGQASNWKKPDFVCFLGIFEKKQAPQKSQNFNIWL